MPFATVSSGSAADVDAAVDAATRALGAWAATSKDERLTLLRRVADIYKRRMDEMAMTISKEMGAPMSLAKSAQAMPCASYRKSNEMQKSASYRMTYLALTT